MLKQVLSGVLACVLVACSSSGPKPLPFEALTPSVSLKEAWGNSVGNWRGNAGEQDASVLRPVVVASSIFAASANGHVARFEAGQAVWSVRAADALSVGVAADKKLVVVASERGELIALDSTSGKVLWRTLLSGEVVGLPLLTEDLVVVRVGDNIVQAVSAADGKQRWIYPRAQSALTLRGHNGFARIGDAVLAGFSGGKLVSLSLAGGFPRWEASIAVPRGANELERMTDLVGEPLVFGDTACVVAYQVRVACVDAARGTVKWSRDVASTTGADGDGRQLYVTTANGQVQALDVRSGATVWTQDKLVWRGLTRPLAVDNNVLVADRLGWVHVLDAQDGRIVGRSKVDSAGFSAPLQSFAKGLALQARDGRVTVLNLDQAVATK